MQRKVDRKLKRRISKNIPCQKEKETSGSTCSCAIAKTCSCQYNFAIMSHSLPLISRLHHYEMETTVLDCSRLLQPIESISLLYSDWMSKLRSSAIPVSMSQIEWHDFHVRLPFLTIHMEYHGISIGINRGHVMVSWFPWFSCSALAHHIKPWSQRQDFKLCFWNRRCEAHVHKQNLWCEFSSSGFDQV